MDLNNCPLCNSKMPQLETCDVCEGYTPLAGDEFPPDCERKSKWRKRYYNLGKHND